MKNSLKSKIITAAYVALTLVASAHASVLNIDDNGLLLGATGVDVNGTLFDVTFELGTCNEIFDGCNNSSEFLFDTFSDAAFASFALEEQVFSALDPIDALLLEDFSTASSLFIPYAPGFPSNDVRVLQTEFSADILAEFTLSDIQAQLGIFLFANFTSPGSAIDEIVDVPAPATFGLFTLGLLGLGLRRKLNQ